MTNKKLKARDVYCRYCGANPGSRCTARVAFGGGTAYQAVQTDKAHSIRIRDAKALVAL